MRGMFQDGCYGTQDDGFGNQIPLSPEAWENGWRFYYAEGAWLCNEHPCHFGN